MKKYGLFLVMIFFFTACSGSTPPSPTQDIQATIETLSNSMVAATLAAKPSDTPAPSNTPLPTATATLKPTETSTPELIGSITLDPTQSGLASATAWSGAFSPGNTSGLPEGFLLIENNTGVKDIIVTLNGTTLLRAQPVYYSYKVGRSLVISILQARYQYIIQIPNKRIFTGSFAQMAKDKSTFRVELNKVVITGP